MNIWLFYTFTRHLGVLNRCFMSANSGGEGRWPTGRWWCTTKRMVVTGEEVRWLALNDEGK
jgi:hypothetical protein